ncbi:N-acetylmuramoyl-L-alanine amidase [Methylosinus sp. Sm6]|uniref:N-acetylmuramoyl-L-alanine amidase n=1 Tax=Methylosinus sp. Sm6 TaxID=2866948 RepID=UPI001C994C5F|nr:N-acetylmuramoyl-L-alanine amidase [Methylosinus sp. Sm6]MBY6241902.1 N-acetylmuramoyl-L-alanine amidase [Methylosinus sp. Sm6]
MVAPDSPFAAELRLSPNHGERLRPLSALILHYTGMPTAAAALRLLTIAESQVSSHYFVDEDGTILQLVSEARRAWHAGHSFWAGEEDINSASIGIEIVHPGHDDPHPFPDRQIEAVAKLCRDICARNAIVPARVLGHSDIAVGRKIDPGEFFPWKVLAERGVGLFVEPAPIVGGETLERGAQGGEVEALQRALADYGYKSPVSGSYGDDTAAVVAAFQRHFRPRLVDGRADASTLETLRALAAGARA